MSNRLEILKGSLAKKEAEFDKKINSHFADVKSANGQPINDKRNGAATSMRWEKQNDSLRSLKESIQKTKDAIEREEQKIYGVEKTKEILPAEILKLIEDGTLIQWRKHPNTFFVAGVDKARIVWMEKKNQVGHKFTSSITDKEQWRKFVSVFNPLGKALNGN